MNNEALKLSELFKSWYRNPKYCNFNNNVTGLTKQYIIKKCFNENQIQELIDNDIIEQHNTGYRLTQQAINDYMAVRL